MRIRALLGSVFASTAILVLGWQAGTTLLGSSTTTTSTSTTDSSSTQSGATGASSTDASSTDASSSSASSSTESAPTVGVTDGTYTGDSIETRFGAVQVSITVSGGAITDVTALQLTDHDSKSVQISNRAAPLLREEVLAAQSANVSNVSGATYTARAYLASVQSALDQAGF